ncbi:MAG: hypothetical protein HYV26_18795 [Candidatus Hydrogenedentes bacterium]|nr:hypothetical protein [Candidatus Hydrogenedentota bacterium]
MNSIETIEEAIRELAPEECSELKAWLDDYHAQLWDARIEADIMAGSLDALGQEALDDLRAGRCTDL